MSHSKRNNDTHNDTHNDTRSSRVTKTQEVSRQLPHQLPRQLPRQSLSTSTNHSSEQIQKNTTRLSEIFRDVPALYMESQQARDPAKKTACYYKIAGLNSEAKSIISNLETLMNSMNTASITSDDNNIDILLDLVSTQNLSFQELMFAVEKFSGILNGLPTKPNVKTDIESEMIYEEEDVASDEL